MTATFQLSYFHNRFSSQGYSLSYVTIPFCGPLFGILFGFKKMYYLSLSRSLDLQEDGCVVDMHQFNSGSQSVLAYATVNGSLVGWDLRSNTNAWTLKHDLRLGLITSFAVDIHQCWLCIGKTTFLCFFLKNV